MLDENSRITGLNFIRNGGCIKELTAKYKKDKDFIKSAIGIKLNTLKFVYQSRDIVRYSIHNYPESLRYIEEDETLRFTDIMRCLEKDPGQYTNLSGKWLKNRDICMLVLNKDWKYFYAMMNLLGYVEVYEIRWFDADFVLKHVDAGNLTVLQAFEWYWYSERARCLWFVRNKLLTKASAREYLYIQKYILGTSEHDAVMLLLKRMRKRRRWPRLVKDILKFHRQDEKYKKMLHPKNLAVNRIIEDDEYKGPTPPRFWEIIINKRK
jgi:hypothetical protein